MYELESSEPSLQPEPETGYTSRSVTADEMQTALNAIVLETLSLASHWLSIFYALISVAHFFLMSGSIRWIMTAVALACCVLLFSLTLVLKRIAVTSHWAHPLASLLALVVLLNCSIHTALTSDPIQTTNFSLLAIGAGSFFLSRLWLGGILGLIYVTWFGLMVSLDFPEQWIHFAFMQFTASLLAVMIHSIRTKVYQNEIRMVHRIQEAQSILSERTQELQQTTVELQKESSVRQIAEAQLVTLSLVASKTNNSVIITDREGRIEWANDGFTRLTGYSLDEVQNRKPGSFLQGPATNPDTIRSIRERLHARSSFTVEILNYHKSGYPYWVSLNITPVLNDTGEVNRFIAIQTDVSEKKKVEETLQRQALVFENIHDAVVFLDLEGRILDWNPAAKKLFGYPKAEALGLALAEWISPGDSDTLRRILSLRFKQSRRWTKELRFTRRGQSDLLCETTLLPIRDSADNLHAILGVIHDITQRKQAETALRESEERFRSAFENAAIGMALVAPSGQFLRVNRSLCDIFGYTEAQLLDTTFQSLTHPDDLENDRQYNRQILDNKIVAFQLEKRCLHRDGHTLWTLLSVSLVRSPEGTPLYLVSQIQDITERKHYEAAIHDSEERLQDFLDNANDLIQITDPYGRFLYVNRTWRDILGYPEAEIPNLYLWDVVSEESLPLCTSLFQRIIRGEAFTPVELVFKAQDGRKIVVAGGVNCRFENGVPVATRSIFRDITEQKRAAEELRRAKETAEAASLAKSQFLANMSHELRTPLNSVIGFANILLKNKTGNLKDQDVVYLQRIQSNGLHLLELINDILDLSKIEAGKVELNIAPVHLASLLREIQSQFESQVRGQPIRLITRIPDGVAPLPTDAGKLKQILLNLVGNAVKFTPKGDVTLQVQSDPDSAVPTRIDVIDTGIGIPQDRLDIIFNAFQQVDSSTARRFGGTGLGLTISQSLCRLLGYSLQVQSVFGEGSTFSILLSSPSTDSLLSCAVHPAAKSVLSAGPEIPQR